MPSSSYNDLPSSAIQSVDIDYGTDVVTVVYKSDLTKKYYYEVADGDEFDRQFLAEFDKEDFSVGAYINSKISSLDMRLHPKPETYEQMLAESTGQPVIVNGVSKQVDPRRLNAQRVVGDDRDMFSINKTVPANKVIVEQGGPAREPETR